MPIMPPTGPTPPSYPSDRADMWRAIEGLERRMSAPPSALQVKPGVVTSARPSVRVLGQEAPRDVWRVNSGAILEVGQEVACVDTALGLLVLSVIQPPEPGLDPVADPEGFWVESRLDSSAANTYTLGGMGFGAPAADRRIVAVIMSSFASSGQNATPSAVTIGGVEAVLSRALFSTTALGSIAFWSALVPSGESGDVSVTYGLGRVQSSCHVSTYRLPGASEQYAAYAQALGSAGTALDLTVTNDELGGTVAGGWLIAASLSPYVATASPTWAGVGQDAAHLGGKAFSVASSMIAASPHAATVTWASDSAVIGIGLAVAFQTPDLTIPA